MAKVTICHEFDYFEDSEYINNIFKASQNRTVLDDIDQEIRNKLKYSDDKWLDNDDAREYLISIREMINI